MTGGPGGPGEADARAERIVATLTDRRITLAVAESLTGGLLTAAFVAVPGASVVLRGGVVAYDTAIKHSVLGVDAEVLAAHGPVHPDVARQMAVGVRTALALDGVEPEIGISTTGVAGPDAQDGHPPGTAFVGVAVGALVRSFALQLDGDRNTVRAAVVREALGFLEESL